MAMVATLGGTLALSVGLAWLLLPLLATELSRPRDSVWGAVVLLLGLVLVTSAERLTGAPMLAVLCGALVMGRLGGEVALGRWRQLETEEKRRLLTGERWATSFRQLIASMARLLQMGTGIVTGLGSWIAERRRPRTTTKRWVRPEGPGEAPEEEAGDSTTTAGQAIEAEAMAGAAADGEAAVAIGEPPEQRPDIDQKKGGVAAAGSEAPAAIEVSDFSEIDALLAAAVPQPAALEAAEGKAETGALSDVGQIAPTDAVSGPIDHEDSRTGDRKADLQGRGAPPPIPAEQAGDRPEGGEISAEGEAPPSSTAGLPEGPGDETG